MRKWRVLFLIVVIGIVCLPVWASAQEPETWIKYAKENYTDDTISPTHYEIDQEEKTVAIHSRDGLAWWAYQIDHGEGLSKDFSGYTISIDAEEIDLSGRNWRLNLEGHPEKGDFADAVLDGQGCTIKGMTVTQGAIGGSVGYGFIGDSEDDFTIQHLTFLQATISGKTAVGAVLGYVDKHIQLIDVHVEDSQIFGSGKVGGLVGMVGTGGPLDENNKPLFGDIRAQLTVQNCSVQDSTIKGWYNMGGLAGLVQGHVIIDQATRVEKVSFETTESSSSYYELHTVTDDSDAYDRKLFQEGNTISDGVYALVVVGGAENMYGAYAEFYTNGGGAYYFYDNGYENAPHYGFDRANRLNPPAVVQPGLEIVSSENYDYRSGEVKNSVLYYGVYGGRKVLFGYEYVGDGEHVTGKMLYSPTGEDLRIPENVQWYTNLECAETYGLSEEVQGNLTLYTPIEFLYDTNIGKLLDDGSGQLPTVEYSPGAGVPTDFEGWYTFPDSTGAQIKVESKEQIPDTTLKLYDMTNACSVVFNLGEQGEQEWYTTQLVYKNGYATEPKDPSVPGHEFAGWYVEGEEEPYDFATPVQGDLTLVAHWEMSVITVQPADMVIYEGGAGYGGVTDGEGEIIESTETSGLPEPGYHLTLPDTVVAWLDQQGLEEGVDLSENLTFSYQVGGEKKAWKLCYEGVYSTSPPRNVYAIKPLVEGQEPVRLCFKDGNKIISSDHIQMTENSVQETYSMEIDLGDTDLDQIQAKFSFEIGGNKKELTCRVNIGTGNLVIRSTVAEDTYTTKIHQAQSEVIDGSVTAVLGENAHYYVNDSLVELGNPENVELLVDWVSNSDSYRNAMGQAAILAAETTLTNPSYLAAYFDLVDTKNGNTLVTLGGDDITIYWPMPEDADPQGNFQVVHFHEMDRSQDTIVSEEELKDAATRLVDVQIVTLQGRSYITFSTSTFSPFVLVYERKDSPSVPSQEPDDSDSPANPDDTGVSDLLNVKDHMQYLYGYPDRSFGPDQNITRGEAAQVFYNLLLDKQVTITTSFSDVPQDAWYQQAVNTLGSLGIVTGTGEGKFEPERSITRAEFTSMAMKFTKGVQEGENIFSDVREDDWFYSAVVGSIQYGWISGYGDGTFRPNQTISRAEVCAIVNAMLARSADKAYVQGHEETLNSFVDVPVSHWGYYHIVEATNTYEYTKSESGEIWRSNSFMLD